MKCEQAFYTRDSRRGLGIADASNKSDDFIRKCDLVGSHFDTEPSQDTAEFVFYAKPFQRYVGVGVSPSGYSDIVGVNKMVHIIVPQMDSFHPDDVYLRYRFSRELHGGIEDTSGLAEKVLDDSSFEGILQKYGFTEEQLALLLYKALPVVLNEKKLLAVVVPGVEKSEYPDMARELTWLLSRMLLEPLDEKEKYRGNLSYSVLSTMKKNISNVNIAYVEDETIHSYCYCLNRECTENVPQVYRKMAECALHSREAYEEFMKHVLANRIEAEMTTANFELAYLYWSLKECGMYEPAGKDVSGMADGEASDPSCGGASADSEITLRPEELPISFHALVERAYRNQAYCPLLYRVCAVLESGSRNDMAQILGKIFRPRLEKDKETSEPYFLKAYENAAAIAYKADPKLYAFYMDDPMSEQNRGAMQKELWNRPSGSSCILDDLTSAESSEEFVKKLGRYSGLMHTESFLEKVRERAADGYYFGLDLAGRQSLSEILDEEPDAPDSGWKRRICKKIREMFREQGTGLLGQEIGQMEDTYASYSFSLFLEKCRETAGWQSGADCCETADRQSGKDSREPAGWQSGANRRETADQQSEADNRELGREWIRIYVSRIDPEAVMTFYAMDRKWNEDMLNKKMEHLTLEELAVFHDFGDYFEEYAEMSMEIWMRRVEEEILEYKLMDTILDRLADRCEEVQTICGEMRHESYRQMLWKACGGPGNYLWLSYRFHDYRHYNVWKEIRLFDTDGYEELCSQMKGICSDPAKKTVCGEVLRVSELSETDALNRQGYLLWRKIGKEERCTAYDFEVLLKSGYDTQVFDYMNVIQEHLVDHAESAAVKHYFYAEQAKWCLRREEWTADERIAFYQELKENHPDFYQCALYMNPCEIPWDLRHEFKEIERCEILCTGGPITEENIETAARAIYDAEQCFGSDAALIVQRNGEYEEMMSEMENGYKMDRRSLSDLQENIDHYRKKIQSLQKKLEECEADKLEIEERMSRRAQQMENAKRERAGKQAQRQTAAKPVQQISVKPIQRQAADHGKIFTREHPNGNAAFF